MLIRHKIIIWFITLSGLLLALFSVYIYVASATSRRNIFIDRLKKKATDTKEIYSLHDKAAEDVITSITEQSEYVFDEHNHLIFSLNSLNDFHFDESFFKAVSERKEYTFTYEVPGKKYPKEGYAMRVRQGDNIHTIVITAYNRSGFQQLKDLSSTLVVGNLFFLAMIGLSAYVLSANAFQPIKALVAQSESVQGHELGFRLTYDNPRDEIGIVASSFNNVLEKIQALAESQKSFISYASHELRTPLAAVNGILETSLQYDKDDASIKASMAAARKEIQKAVGLVNGLLQLAKIESPDALVEKSNLNVVDVLLDAISFYQMKNPAQEFNFDIAESLAEDIYIEVHGHAQLLRTALINLIDNASKYSRQQPVEIKLMVESPEKVFIQIIVNEDLPFLLDPFYRGKNVSGFEGFGLGLPLTQRILALHNGAVTLLKNEYGGVTANVVLPAFF